MIITNRLIMYSFLLTTLLLISCTNKDNQITSEYNTLEPSGNLVTPDNQFLIDIVKIVESTNKIQRLTPDNLQKLINSSNRVDRNSWLTEYSHVALQDRHGWGETKQGNFFVWLIKPGGLTNIRFSDGRELYLVKSSQNY